VQHMDKASRSIISILCRLENMERNISLGHVLNNFVAFRGRCCSRGQGMQPC
jgi:hypothetical protein